MTEYSVTDEWLETASQIVRDVQLLNTDDAVKLVVLWLETAALRGEKIGFKDGIQTALDRLERAFAKKDQPHVQD